jgi:gliding motility-associated-like protein
MKTKNLVYIILCFISTSTIKGQLSINNSYTATQLVQDYLVGNGVTVSNVTVNSGSDSRQFGYFTNSNSNLPISEGIVMMTGYSDDLNNINTNTDGSFTSMNNNPPPTCFGGICVPGDSDLNNLIFPDITHDAAVLEFDFIPLSDTIRFRYVFASEEYNEYVCSDFNDIFAFFISGPGFAVPTNLAIIPNTNPPLPVTINNVNNGSIGSLGNSANCSATQLANSGYFIDNNNGMHVQFDGMTVSLEAWAVVQACSTYHIKLAIADAFDGNLDSGIFLEAGSFSSSGMIVESVTTNGDSIITEQCNEGRINFIFNNPPANDTTFFFTIAGTATNGTDYQQLADSINVQSGDSIATIDILPISDGITEGIETIILIIPTNICSSDTVLLYIGEDVQPPAPDSLNCYNLTDSTISFGWNAVPGATGYQISTDNGTTWTAPNNGMSHQFSGITANTSIAIWVSAIDTTLICTTPGYDSLVCMGCGLGISETPNLLSWIGQSPTTDSSIYLNESIIISANNLSSGTFNYTWIETNNNSSLNIDDTNLSSTSVHATDTGTYTLQIIASAGNGGILCTDTSIITLRVLEEAFLGIPTAFSPNGDGINDYFRPLNLNPSYIAEFKLFNRWGQTVYDDSGLSSGSGWDGKYREAEQAQDVYLFLLNYQLPGQQEKTIRGEVSLLR